MAVPQHDALDPAHAHAGRRDGAGHGGDPRVEHGDSALVLDEVDVHGLHRESAADEPDTVGDPLRSARREPPPEARSRVERRGHPLLGGRLGGREQPELASERSAVEVGVVLGDEAVGGTDQVAALELDARAGGLDPAKAPGARERSRRPPAHGAAVVLGGDVQDLEGEVGEGSEQLGEVLAHAVGRDQVDLAHHVIDGARGPAGHHPIDVAGDQGIEVGGGRLGGFGSTVGGPG
jgi:hypothetical protein